ncbi:DUF2971 domain-containing protein [Methylophaga sp.]|uniref:DUF2971 domain-containing protein n=1 Tax=Methylophaga sp. TaxID=2024840 RepID=UPI003A8E959A
MSIPQRLYKYEPLTIQTLLNLKSQVLYFGPPANFNDPYDCAIRANVREPTIEEVEEFRSKYSRIEEFPDTTRHALKSANANELRAWLKKIGQESMNLIAEKNIRTRGVTCFSELNDELLMWSHYADKYKGICLEFDTQYEPFSKARKVRYCQTMPSLSITDALLNNNYEQILDLYCTKSSSWGYEKEWRCIHKEAGTKWVYESQALTGVYFGPAVDLDALEIVCLILQGQNHSASFFRGKRSDERFVIDFEQFDYIPYLIAKDSGLTT